jgi:mannose/fructose/N-acetylgalactosamine-specific phosphotransferase system component IID
MKLKLTGIHLWILACIAYGFAVTMAFQGEIAVSILFAIVYLSLLISTRWTANNE